MAVPAPPQAGADRITFQIEHLEDSPDIERRAFELAQAIRAAGGLAGVCLAPHTPLSAIDALNEEYGRQIRDLTNQLVALKAHIRSQQQPVS